MQITFNAQHLSELGFVGFEPVRAMPRGCPEVPSSSGIYAVLLDPAAPDFLERSVGGHFKGKDGTVGMHALTAKWIDEVSTLYIGRAKDLRKRIDLLARYGRGEPVGHQGGRYLWQTAAHDELRVAWRLEDDPVQAECELLDEFESAFGQLPFANLVRGTRVPAMA